MRVEIERVAHAELAGQRVHVGDGVARRIKAGGVGKGAAEVIGQRHRRHIVGSEKAGEEQVAEGQDIASL